MEKSSANQPKIMLLLSMVIFGTIGIFRKYIPLPSTVIALVRAVIGMVFLLLLSRIRKKESSIQAIKTNLLPLLLSGAVLGFNWILLFEAYQYTTVAVATLCYYMAPIFVIIASPFLLKERLTQKKVMCVIAALAGMVLVSGVIRPDSSQITGMKGILLGIGAAVLYAGVILLNKKIKNISAYDKTIVQLGVAAIVLIPYMLLTENIFDLAFKPLTVIMLLIVGVLHTGMAYALYFGSMNELKAQTVALYSYIDPIVAIVLSAVILQEKMEITEVIGAGLVLGATMTSEMGKRVISNRFKQQ